MSNPSDYRYARTHEWVRVEDGVAIIGITDYAAEQLGEVIYVELADVGRPLKQFERLGVVESLKAVSDLYAPLSGEVTETNKALADRPELVSLSPFDEGWMVKLSPSHPEELDNLLSREKYEEMIGGAGSSLTAT